MSNNNIEAHNKINEIEALCRVVIDKCTMWRKELEKETATSVPTPPSGGVQERIDRTLAKRKKNLLKKLNNKAG